MAHPLAEGDNAAGTANPWVRETAFGRWFLTTQMWRRYVVAEAVEILAKLTQSSNTNKSANANINFETVLDIGCGSGAAFELLTTHFQPRHIIAFDLDTAALEEANQRAKDCPSPIRIEAASVYALPLDSNSVDAVFCHQLLHHLTNQQGALAEIYRVLNPGGALLISESCEPFIERWWVRWFFRHPKRTQRNAEQYLSLMDEQGFETEDSSVHLSRPWWSQFWMGIQDNTVVTPLNASEITAVARKPAIGSTPPSQ